MDRKELSKILQKERIPSDWYSLYGDLEPDRIILYLNYHKWEVFYLDERGGRTLLKSCRTEEEACAYIHQHLVQELLSHKSIYYSHPPVIIPNTTVLIWEVGFLETAIRIWIDSIIMVENNWSEITIVIFEIERDNYFYQKYKINLYGSKEYTTSQKEICYSVDAIPYHDWISIKSEKNEDIFEKEVSSILYRSSHNNEVLGYRCFFAGKKICVGFRNRIHIL